MIVYSDKNVLIAKDSLFLEIHFRNPEEILFPVSIFLLSKCLVIMPEAYFLISRIFAYTTANLIKSSMPSNIAFLHGTGPTASMPQKTGGFNNTTSSTKIPRNILLL